MNWKIWLPVLVSLPVSVMAGLLVEPTRTLLVKVAGKAAREKWARRFEEKKRGYVDFPETFTQYLLVVVIRLLAMIAVWFTGLLLIMLIVLMVGVRKYGNSPLPEVDRQDLLQVLWMSFAACNVALIGFTYQLAHCYRWWSLVQDARKSQPTRL